MTRAINNKEGWTATAVEIANKEPKTCVLSSPDYKPTGKVVLLVNNTSANPYGGAHETTMLGTTVITDYITSVEQCKKYDNRGLTAVNFAGNVPVAVKKYLKGITNERYELVPVFIRINPKNGATKEYKTLNAAARAILKRDQTVKVVEAGIMKAARGEWPSYAGYNWKKEAHKVYV